MKPYKNNINIYLALMFCSSVGNKLYSFMLPLIVYKNTNSTFQMGLMFLVQTLPTIVSANVAGTLIKKYRLEFILRYVTIVQVFLVLTLSLILFQGDKSIYFVHIIGFLLSSCARILKILDTSMIVELSPKSSFTKVKSYNEILSNIARIAGPVIAGFLLSFQPYFIIILISAFTFLPVLIYSNYIITQKNSVNENIEKKKSGGLDYILKNDILLFLVLFSLAINIFNGSVSALFVVYTQEVLEINVITLSYIYTLITITQVAVSCALSFMTKFSTVKFWLITIQLISGIGIVIMSRSNFWWIFLFGSILNETTTLISNIINKTYRQLTIPRGLLGQVNGVYVTIAILSYSLAGFLSAIIAEFVGVGIVILCSGIGMIVVTLVVIRLDIVNALKIKYTDFVRED